MAATIKDIARKLNLSVSTVSYALNNGPKPVSEQVRERVLAAAMEMEYRPNRVARSLVTRRTNAIGIVPPKIHRDLMLSVFVQQALNGIVNAAEDKHQDLLLYTAFDRSREGSAADGVLDSRIDGVIIIAPSSNPHLMRALDRHGLPYATVADDQPHGDLSFAIDNSLGTVQVMSHLYDLGHRRIAHIAGPTDYLDSRLRACAYEEFMRDRGIFRSELLVEGNYWRPRGRDLALKLLALPEPPTAIYAANDDTALGVYEAAADLGLEVPKDLSVVGFDDLPFGRDARPALTTVRQPVEEMGYAALCAVMDRIEGRSPASHSFPTSLVIRESTAPPRGEVLQT